MTYTAKIKIQYDGEWESTSRYYSSFEDGMLPKEHITMEIPAEDLSTMQLFKFFSNFLRAIGHNEVGIMKGACFTAFNEMHNVEDMRKIADEFDLKLAEDYSNEFCKLQDEIYDLKEKLSRYEQPDKSQYTDEEMDAMTASQFKQWNNLIPGSPDAVEKGCLCPILDNQEMPADKKWVDSECPIHGRKNDESN
jgi:hypothetical protein